MPDASTILLSLKVLVAGVTVLFAASLAALLAGNIRLHGRINTVFLILTLTTVFGFEVLLRLGTDVVSHFSPEARAMLKVHLYFAIPAACLLPLMYASGIKRRRSLHIGLGLIFAILWIGTVITGLVFLPHA